MGRSRSRRNAGASDSGSPHSGSGGPASVILIVDDHADTREMYSMYLASQGMRIVVAGDGVTAIRMAVADRPDVIVMDLSLPVIDGLETIRRLKRDGSTAHIPIVACTGRVDGGSGESAIEAGCDAYVLKPCLPEHLLKEIRTLLARANRQYGA